MKIQLEKGIIGKINSGLETKISIDKSNAHVFAGEREGDNIELFTISAGSKEKYTLKSLMKKINEIVEEKDIDLMKHYKVLNGFDWIDVDEEWLANVDLQNVSEIEWMPNLKKLLVTHGAEGNRYTVTYSDIHGSWGFPTRIR